MLKNDEFYILRPQTTWSVWPNDQKLILSRSDHFSTSGHLEISSFLFHKDDTKYDKTIPETFEPIFTC